MLAVASISAFIRSGTPFTPPNSPPSFDDEPEFFGSALYPLQSAPDFSLIDQHGEPYRLSEQEGNVVVLFFGYTTCPDVCPGTLAHYRQVKELLGEQAQRVQFVFVTVDPARDSPQRLGEYVALFDPAFYGLTGPLDKLEEAWRAYGVYIQETEAEPGSAVDYWIDHSTTSYVIDAAGNLRLTHMFGDAPEEVASDLERLLEEASVR